MAKRRNYDGPSLFDEPDPTSEPAAQSIDAQPQSDWQEVPQTLFLSWSQARQFAYCAARDEDAAEFSETYAEAQWYMERASAYRELSRA
jgi:hypothetical protein